jgi:hypothetical protein
MNKATTSAGKATQTPLQGTGIGREDFWGKAWASVQQDTKHTKLLKEYEKVLLSAYMDADGSTSSSMRPGRSGPQEQIARLVARTIQDVDKKKMVLSVGSKELVVRDQVDRIVKALLFAQTAVTAAVSSQPYAAIAWSGVCLLVNVSQHRRFPVRCAPFNTRVWLFTVAFELIERANRLDRWIGLYYSSDMSLLCHRRRV